MRRTVILVVSVITLGAAEAVAQPSERDLTVSELQTQLAEMRSQMAAMQKRIVTLEAVNPLQGQPLAPQPIRPQPEEEKKAEPTAFQFKGLTVTPGGYLESTVLVRTRNENADLATSYSATPLNGSSNGRLSEFRGTARHSSLSLLIQGSAGSARLRGYVETDFLGAAPTANYVQSSSFTPRLRQVWTQLEWPSGWSITAGQMWSLLTTNRRGIANLEEWRPSGQDGSFVVGFTWTRERAVRCDPELQQSRMGGLRRRGSGKYLFGAVRSAQRHGVEHQPERGDRREPSAVSCQLQQRSVDNPRSGSCRKGCL
jgi:hypothetical protein